MHVLVRCCAALVLIGVATAPTPVRAGVNYVYFTVVLSGNGSGRVTTLDGPDGNPDGLIDCRIVNGYVDPREQCDFQYDGGDDSTIRLYYRVTPATGSCLQPGGPCLAAGYHTYIDVTNEATKYFTFNLQTYLVTASKSGPGGGTITSAPAGISCGGTCSWTWPYGTSVTLTANPNGDSYVQGWSLSCIDLDPTCNLTVTSAMSAIVVFQLGTAPTPGTSPTASPFVSPGATPKATTKPASTPIPTARPSTGAASSAATSTEPSAAASVDPSDGVSTPGASSPGPGASPPATAGAPTAPPVDPAGGGGSDATPIVLAILGAGLFIAIAIGLVGFGLLRRSRA